MRAALLLVCAFGTAAIAEPIPPKARALAQQGQALHASGDYAGAIAAFQAAYSIAPAPALLFNIAQAYRMSNDCDDAVLMYRRFLASDPDPTTAEVARGHLATVERCAHPESASQLVRPPAEIHVVVPPPPLVVHREPLPAFEAHRGIEIGLGVVGVASLGVALLYGVDAHAAASEVNAGYARGAAWKDLAPADARGKHDERAAALFGIGGVLAIGGAIGVHFYDRHVEHDRLQLSLGTTHGGARVGVSWTF